MQALFVCSFIFLFFSMLGAKDNTKLRFQFKEDLIMAEVEVIKAVDGPILRKRDYEGNPLVITRQRVAAYVIRIQYGKNDRNMLLLINNDK